MWASPHAPTLGLFSSYSFLVQASMRVEAAGISYMDALCQPDAVGIQIITISTPTKTG